ncbi:Hypothetical protein NTJ_11577 [Nesidiocoris tenuis]|uniref:Folded gastrulation N-terminal domain-containing protein n=2 Tax=Nesidiocoris tenuis TaxID=355587 RepID=A0ABN7B560_9HEMI|nr:Hypothetical protein NTJ_11577 [Nesidiocoris tenuis]
MWIWALWVVGAAIGAILSAPGALGQPGAEPPGASAQGAMLENRELAWILANNDETVPSAPLSLRRITAKSVFLAPTFTSSCSEGYRQDALGRCVKVVKLNQQAQWEYFLQKLNSMYAANQPPVSVPAKDKPPAGPFRLPIPLGDAETTTTLPMTTDESTTVTSTQQTTMTSPTTMVTTEAERGTETPLLIIVANTTDQPESTTDRETSAATDNSDVRTSTELPATMTTLSMSTTTDCDDCSTTTSPSTGGFFFSQSQNGDSYETNTAMTTNDDFPTTTRPTAFRPSAYLPAAGDEYLHYQQSQDQHNNHVRQSTTTDRTGSVDSLIRPQSHRFSTTPAPSTLWPEDDPLPYGTRLDFSTTYTTRRSTVRFPSERPAVLSALPTNGYIRFPPTHDPPWWPPSWAGQQIHQSQWPPHPQRLGISGRPWGSNREPRPSWNLQ